MYKGIYIALSGSSIKQSHIEVISHNLANAQTVGYKKDKVAFREFLMSQLNGVEEGQDSRVMSDLSKVTTDYAEGNMLRTGNPLDVAIEGKGYLALEGGQFTRRGDLAVSDGQLVTKGGLKVLGKSGPIRIPRGKAEISPAGGISVDGVQVGTLKIVEFPDSSLLKKVGDDLFSSADAGGASEASVRQGYLETSNVDVIREMIGLISAMREFETMQKAVQAFDESTGKVTNDMGRI